MKKVNWDELEKHIKREWKEGKVFHDNMFPFEDTKKGFEEIKEGMGLIKEGIDEAYVYVIEKVTNFRKGFKHCFGWFSVWWTSLNKVIFRELYETGLYTDLMKQIEKEDPELVECMMGSIDGYNKEFIIEGEEE